jgi:phosphoribosylamine---glycine ligase
LTNILVVGGGAREHALAWALGQSPQRPRVYVAPGNPGVDGAWLGAREAVQGGIDAPRASRVDIAPDDVEALFAYARAQQIDLTVVGPEAPLMLGLADRFRASGLRVVGPNRAAARLEGSKAFAKEMMARAGIPTARHETFSEVAAARAYVERHGAPVVVKADGIAAGKGVVVAYSVADAMDAVDAIMERRIFAAAGDTVVIEEYLEGDELSVMAFVSGDTYRLLPPTQDHKQVFDGDSGPNTGGMGAFAPVPWADETLLAPVRTRILEPLLNELVRSGFDYRGVIYAGLMITRDGPKVIEFNARLGDPEAQVALPLLACDLVEVLLAVADGTLDRVEVPQRPGAAVGVVLASQGYPGSYSTGHAISQVRPFPDQTLLFHGGTRDECGQLVTAGGRVLTAVGPGVDLVDARARAYAAADAISFAGKHYRHDIGARRRRIE